MRCNGVSPAIVFINDYACDVNWFEHRDHATVEILPTETVDMLDFRFANGITVSIIGSTIKRAKAIARACQTAGAVTVAAGCVERDEKGYTQPGWAHIWRKPVEVEA
jgi:hypothetical protein